MASLPSQPMAPPSSQPMVSPSSQSLAPPSSQPTAPPPAPWSGLRLAPLSPPRLLLTQADRPRPLSPRSSPPTPPSPAPAAQLPPSTPPTASTPAVDPQALLPPLLKPDDSQAPARVDPTQLDRAYRRARTTRDVGISLAAPGVALSLVGGVILIFTSRAQQIFTQSSQIIGGTISLAAGIAIAVPGIYFWTTGQDDMDTVVWRRRQLTSSPP
jgi:hypothetical protein